MHSHLSGRDLSSQIWMREAGPGPPAHIVHREFQVDHKPTMNSFLSIFPNTHSVCVCGVQAPVGVTERRQIPQS